MNYINEKELFLHKVAAKYIIGENVQVELDGSYAELVCLKELLDISKELKKSLDEDSSFDSIIDLMNKKKDVTSKFESLTGITWRL